MFAAIEDGFDVETLGDLMLAGFQRPTPGLRLVGARSGGMGGRGHADREEG